MQGRVIRFCALLVLMTAASGYLWKATDPHVALDSAISCEVQNLEIGLVDPSRAELLPIRFRLENRTSSDIGCSVRTSCGCIATEPHITLSAKSEFELNINFQPPTLPGIFRKRVVVEPDDLDRFDPVFLTFFGEIAINPSLRANLDLLDFGVVKEIKRRELWLIRNDGSHVGTVGAECPPGIRLLKSVAMEGGEMLSFECEASELQEQLVSGKISINTVGEQHNSIAIPVKARRDFLSTCLRKAVFVRGLTPGCSRVVDVFEDKSSSTCRPHGVNWRGDKCVRFSLDGKEIDGSHHGQVRVEIDESITKTRLISGYLDVHFHSAGIPTPIQVSLFVSAPASEMSMENSAR